MATAPIFVPDTDSEPEPEPEPYFSQYAQHWCTQRSDTDIVSETDLEDLEQSDDSSTTIQLSQSLQYQQLRAKHLDEQRKQNLHLAVPSTSPAAEGNGTLFRTEWPDFIQNAEEREAYYTHMSPSEHSKHEDEKPRPLLERFYYFRDQLHALMKRFLAQLEPEPPSPTLEQLRDRATRRVNTWLMSERHVEVQQELNRTCIDSTGRNKNAIYRRFVKCSEVPEIMARLPDVLEAEAREKRLGLVQHEVVQEDILPLLQHKPSATDLQPPRRRGKKHKRGASTSAV